jgi:hypothetical protein
MWILRKIPDVETVRAPFLQNGLALLAPALLVRTTGPNFHGIGTRAIPLQSSQRTSDLPRVRFPATVIHQRAAFEILGGRWDQIIRGDQSGRAPRRSSAPADLKGGRSSPRQEPAPVCLRCDAVPYRASRRTHSISCHSQPQKASNSEYNRVGANSC